MRPIPTVLSVLAFWLLSVLPAAAQQGWFLAEGQGSIVVDGQIAMPGTPLPAGAWIETDAGASAVLTRGEQRIALGEGTRIVLPSDGGGRTVLRQERGEATYAVDKRRTPHFEVRTRFVAAVVKGTVFTVSAEGTSHAVTTLEGLVAVAPAMGGEARLVGAGFRARGDRGGVVVTGAADTPPSLGEGAAKDPTKDREEGAAPEAAASEPAAPSAEAPIAAVDAQATRQVAGLAVAADPATDPATDPTLAETPTSEPGRVPEAPMPEAPDTDVPDTGVIEPEVAEPGTAAPAPPATDTPDPDTVLPVPETPIPVPGDGPDPTATNPPTPVNDGRGNSILGEGVEVDGRGNIIIVRRGDDAPAAVVTIAVDGNDNEATGDAIVIDGNRNKVDGTDVYVDGNRNTLRPIRALGDDVAPDFGFVVTTTITGNLNLVTGLGNTVNGNNNTLTGYTNTASGNRNRVVGNGNVVEGSANTLRGVWNNVVGEENRVEGDFNVVYGDENHVFGNDNYVSGDENLIEGDANILFGDENEIYGDRNQIARDEYVVRGDDEVRGRLPIAVGDLFSVLGDTPSPSGTRTDNDRGLGN